MAGGSTLIPTVVVLAASAARTTVGDTGNLKNTAGALPYAESYSLYCNVTAVSSGVQLSVSLDGSYDGGTTWVPIEVFSQFATAIGIKRIDFRNGVSLGEVAAQATITYGTALTQNTVVPLDHRVSWFINGTSFTFTVFAFCNPVGAR